MNEEMLSLLDDLVVAKHGKPLSVIEREIIRQSWQNVKYKDMQISNYTPSYIEKGLARNLWNLLSEVIGDGERVTKKNLKILMQQAMNTRSRHFPPAPPPSQESKDAIMAYNRSPDCDGTGDLIQEKRLRVSRKNQPGSWDRL
ncbi:MAG: hypothetical protein RLZZ338_1860 [Cyanobacteriota bacterium]|jgi:hypothetical protein